MPKRSPTLALLILLTGAAAGLAPSLARAQVPEAVTPERPSLGAAPRWAAPPDEALQAAPEAGPAAEATSGGFSVDISRREETRNFYNAVYKASQGVASGWTGDVSACRKGGTALDFRSAVQRRVNFYRAMAGMPAKVALYGTASGTAQAAALMMSANNSLSHSPPSSWACYTDAGATAAGQSNIALGTSGADSIDAYIKDNGSNNAAVGHRRWILYPKLYRIGTGDAAPERQASRSPANALWVLDPTMWSLPRPATRAEYVAWPVAGYMPAPLVPARWSFSYPGADFSAAVVSMRSGSEALTVAQESLSNGYGDNTLVWRPTLPANPTGGDVSYGVTIDNVRVNGVARRFEYVTTAFDPARYGADTVLPAITGPTALNTGSTGSFQMKAVRKVSGYQWRAMRAVNDYATKVHGAEQEGLGDLAPAPAAAYAIVSTDYAATGSGAYHLAQNGGVAQALVFSPTFVPSTGASLSFASRLGWATTSQFAAVQVSTDEGATWVDLHRQAGSGGSGETGFSSRSVSLADYVNRPIRLRLYYGSTGSYYPQTTKGIGWYVDDIRLQNVLRVASTSAPQDSGRTFDFTPAQAGTYFLSARGVLFKDFPLEWSGTTRVAVTAP